MALVVTAFSIYWRFQVRLAKEFEILERKIGNDTRPYVIAEIGSNFCQSKDMAKTLIDVAAEAGADAVKFQLFRADVLYPDYGEMYELFKSLELDAGWLSDLSKHATDQNLHFLASAFDNASVQALQNISVPVYKVASSEATNFPLLIEIAKTGAPIFISTGMCNMTDIEQIVEVCLNLGNPNVALLQCGAQYPLPEDLTNLRVIADFKNRYECPVGFSDHTLGQNAAIAAIGAGATIFEKHFTLDKTEEGPDHFYAMEPEELKKYITAIHQASSSMGNGVKSPLEEERRLGRREGLYATTRLPIGHVFSHSDIEAKRPALGIAARYRDALVGARLNKEIASGEPIDWDHLSKNTNHKIG